MSPHRLQKLLLLCWPCLIIMFSPKIWNKLRYADSMVVNQIHPNSEITTHSFQLPIIQVIKNGSLYSEFICDSNSKLMISKLQAALDNEKSKNSGLIKKYATVENLYSDNMVVTALKENDNVVLKLYRSNCRSCNEVEPMFIEVANQYYSSYRWFQAAVDDVPDYMNAAQERLSGAVQDLTFDMANDCATCGNTGLVECSDCSGSGIVMRGTIAVFCPTCTGKKKIRCSDCGGKCVNCVS